MSRSDDARYALAVIAGRVDLTDPAIAARLAVLKAWHFGDDGLRGLIDRAADMHVAGLERDPRAVDAAFLRAVAEGSVNFLDDPVWQRLEPIHERHKADAEMMALFAQASDAFADAALDAAAAVLVSSVADSAIEQARRRAQTE